MTIYQLLLIYRNNKGMNLIKTIQYFVAKEFQRIM